jgi:hypothetical protein
LATPAGPQGSGKPGSNTSPRRAGWQRKQKYNGFRPRRSGSSGARKLLAPVHDWFTEGFDTPVLKEAKSLMG